MQESCVIFVLCRPGITKTGEIMYTDGIIFDVDGTLWDSTPIVAEAWTQAVLKCGIKDRIVTAGELKQLFGKTMSVIAASLFPEASKEVQEIILEKCCVYEEEALEENQQDICYPDVREVIKQLAKTYDLYIVSNCQCGYIEQFLRKTQLEAYIKDIECFGNTGKNKGENIRLLVKRNSLKAPVYIGDTKGDCDASKEAGVPFIFASYGFGNVTEYAAKIGEMKDLLTLFSGQ